MIGFKTKERKELNEPRSDCINDLAFLFRRNRKKSLKRKKNKFLAQKTEKSTPWMTF